MNKSDKDSLQKKISTGLRAGASKVDITCPAGELAYGLYPEKTMEHIPPQFRDLRVKIDDPLYVRALVIDDGNEPVVLVTMDCCAIGARTISQYILYDSPDDFMPRLRKRVQDELGIPGAQVSVSATHVHPPGRLLCDEEEQISRTVAAIRQAQASLTPVKIGVGAGHEETLTYNRTWMMKDGTDWSWRPESLGAEIERMRPIDPEIGIVRIDRLDGQALAVLYDFASHILPAARSGNLTADFPGVTAAYLEEQLGEGVTAIFLQGANGDINEFHYDDREHRRDKYDFGYRLGRSIMEAYQKIKPGDATIKVVTRQAQFPLRTDVPEVIAALKQEQADLTASLRYVQLSFKNFLPLYLKYALHPDFPNDVPQRYLAAEARGDQSMRVMDEQNLGEINVYLQGMRAMEKMSINELKIATLKKHEELIAGLGGKSVSAEIKGIRIGESVFIAVPMEMLSEGGFKIKKLSPFKHTYVISDSNGYLHYSPPASYYGRGGYEVTECLLAPEWEKIFLDMLPELFAALSCETSMKKTGEQ